MERYRGLTEALAIRLFTANPATAMTIKTSAPTRMRPGERVHPVPCAWSSRGFLAFAPARRAMLLRMA